MNSFVYIALFAILACASAKPSLIAPISEVIQGPSTRTTIVGPDGSAISSVAPGGTVITEGAHLLRSAPILAPAPVIPSVMASPWLARTLPMTYAPLARSFIGHRALDTLVAGPSGTIATSRLGELGMLGHSRFAWDGLYL